jgi:lipopolysaccharide export system protein LptA
MLHQFETMRLFFFTLVVSFIGMTISTVIAAERSSPDNVVKNNQEIQIIADQLISNSQDKFAEFIGNVEVTQGTFVIKSEKLRIYYRSMAGISNKPSATEESIEKIIATGNVKIWSDDSVAETEQAVYSFADMVLVLSGENSTVISGKNSITGSKIILYRKDGRIKVQGSDSKRVKAIFHPGQKKTSEKDEQAPVKDSAPTPIN